MQNQSIDNIIVGTRPFHSDDEVSAAFRKLRHDAPVHWTEPEGYRPFWTLTKYEDIVEIERRSVIFINAPRNVLRTAADEDQVRRLTGGEVDFLRTLTQMDNPEHRKYRDLASASFMPKGIESIKADIAAYADDAIAKLRSLGGRCEFVNDVAMWFPVRVLVKALGLAAAEEPAVLEKTKRLILAQESSEHGQADSATGQEFWDIYNYFSAVCKDRRESPREDLATAIANSTIDGKPISDHEVVSYYLLLVTAGHETTASSLSGGVMLLSRNPAEFKKLRVDPSLIPAAVNEVIRCTTPIKHFFRTATRDFALRGKTIRAGDSVLLHYASGNRDEDVFDEPDRFLVDRDKPARHIGFGSGIHVCLGQHLARLELQSFLSRFVENVQDLELDGSPEHVRSNFLGGLKALPLRYSMAETQIEIVL
jgi:cytochrome P450